MIQKYIEVLQNVKSGKLNYDEFQYLEDVDSDGISFDANHIKRYQLLLAMRFENEQCDYDLLKNLFQAELTMHQNAPFQGIHSSLNLCSYLLSKLSDPKCVWLFVAAKSANFDTLCGYDYEYLVSAGVQSTYEYVADCDHELKKVFYEYVGDSPETCYITDEHLKTWYECKMIEFNGNYNQLNIEDEIELVKELNESEIVKEKVGKWKNEKQKWDLSALLQLSYYESLCDNIQGEIWANEQILATLSNEWDIMSQAEQLCDLYLKSNNSEQAWKSILLAKQYISLIEEWPNIGIAWMLVESCFDIVLQINNSNDTVARDAYVWAIEEAKGIKQQCQNLMKKAYESAEIMADAKNREYFFDKFIEAEEEFKRMFKR